MRRILAIAHKEMLHILRDPRSLSVAILMPAAMVLLFGYAIDMELNNLRVAILDRDRSPDSRALIREMTSSGFIVEAKRLHDRSEIDPGFRRREFYAAIIIPQGYAASLATQPNTRVQAIIDGADGSTAATVALYLHAVVQRMNLDLAMEQAGGAHLPIEARTRFLFNPQLRSADFIVPGLAAVVLMMICALLTSIAVTREKETGTLEQILTTPVAPGQVIIGKVIPYILLSAFDTVLILAVGYLVFDVPMRGSWLVLAGYSFIYLMIALGLGLVISAISKTQQVAMMLALVATLLPTMLLSGFVFAHSSMPLVLQWVGKIIPATYYLVVVRGVMLAGRSWFPLELGVMIGMAVVLLTVAVKRFKVRLE